MSRIDFTFCASSGLDYGGSERKAAILFNRVPYMLKFAKKNVYGHCFNDVAEDLASHIFSLLGLPVQTTLLGVYRGENVVACKDFRTDGVFVPFDSVGESALDEGNSRIGYRYEDIEELIGHNKKLGEKEEALCLFWKTYLVDALLANPDRHGKNWGFLKKDNVYHIAPIFDNGSSLFSSFSDAEEMAFVLSNQDEIDERVFSRPVSLIQKNGAVSSYFEVISSLFYPRLNQALLELFPRIKLDSIHEVIASCAELTPLQKAFLNRILEERYRKILQVPYQRLREAQS